MHADPAEVIADQLTFPLCTPTRSSLPKVSGAALRSAMAARTARAGVKGGEHTVAARLHDAASIATHFSLDESVVALENISPSAIAQRSGALCRAHDVGEQDSCEHPIDRPVREVARQKALISSSRASWSPVQKRWSLPASSTLLASGISCDPARKGRRDDPITFAVKDQGRRPDTRQQRTDVEMQLHLEERPGTAWAEA